MRSVFGVVAIVGCLFAWQAAAEAAGPVKLGVVDLQRCIQETQEGRKIYQELKTKKDAMQKTLDDKQQQLVKLQEDLERQSMMLSVDAKEDKQKEFERKTREFKYLYEDLSEEMRKAEMEAKKVILQDLETIVGGIGTKDSYQIIFERRSSGIMFVDEAIDITEQVIKAYDQSRR